MPSIDEVPSLCDVIPINSDENEMPLFENSCYYDSHSFCNIVKNKRNDLMTFFNANARSLVKNITAYETYFQSLYNSHEFSFDVITFTETWASNQLEDVIQFEGYNSEFKHKVNRKEGGGLAFYIENSLKYELRPDIQFPTEKQSEYDALFIEIISNEPKTRNTIIGNIYRSPNFNNITEFTDHLQILTESFTENKNLVITGDFNIDLIKANTNTLTCKLLDMMISNNMRPCITLPTRITHNTATLIDHIYTNIPPNKTLAGTLTTDISDHFSNFIFITTKLRKSHPKYVTYRPFNKTALAKFNEELIDTDFSEVYIDDPSAAYSNFISKITYLRDKHMPITTKRFNKYKHKTNPWISKGILNSLRTKDLLFNKLKKAKTETQIVNLEFQYNKYKKIYGKVIRSAKKLYWKSRFTECSKDIIVCNVNFAD